MGLFDKLFNDDEKEKQEEAKRKAAEKYAEEHAHAHAAESAEPVAAKKTAAKRAAAKEEPAAKPAVAKEPAKKAPAKKVAAPAAAEAPAVKAAIPHQHTPTDAPHTHVAPVANSVEAVTAAHDQSMTLHVLSHIPDHAPREDDPHYHLFEQAKARLKRQGMWKCMIGDDLCSGEPELHHTFIEFSQINEVDPTKIQQALGLHFASDEEFQKWAESPGNLEVLCVGHHRAHYGIHVIPGPLWEAIRFRKKGTEAAAEFVSAADMAKQGD